MSGVIYETTPEKEGWICLAPRLWKQPDGKLYKFSPDAREVILKYRQLGPDEILRL